MAYCRLRHPQLVGHELCVARPHGFLKYNQEFYIQPREPTIPQGLCHVARMSERRKVGNHPIRGRPKFCSGGRGTHCHRKSRSTPQPSYGMFSQISTLGNHPD